MGLESESHLIVLCLCRSLSPPLLPLCNFAVIKVMSTWELVHRETGKWRRLLFNILWYGSQIGIFAYGWWAQVTYLHSSLLGIDLSTSGKETNLKLASLNTLGFSVWISRGAGLVLAYDGGLILLPVLRNLIKVLRPKLIVRTFQSK